MRKNTMEKRLVWIVAVALTLNTNTFMSAAYAQLSAPTPDKEREQHVITPEDADGRGDEATKPLRSVYPPEDGALQKSDAASEEEVSEETEAEHKSIPFTEVKKVIQEGLENHFKTSVELELLPEDIAPGMTPELMEKGGTDPIQETKIRYAYTTLGGLQGEVEAHPEIGEDGKITLAGVQLSEHKEKPPLPEQSKSPVRDTDRDGAVEKSHSELKSENGVVRRPEIKWLIQRRLDNRASILGQLSRNENSVKTILAYWHAKDPAIDGGGRRMDEGKMEMEIHDGMFSAEAPMQSSLNYDVRLVYSDGTVAAEMDSPAPDAEIKTVQAEVIEEKLPEPDAEIAADQEAAKQEESKDAAVMDEYPAGPMTPYLLGNSLETAKEELIQNSDSADLPETALEMPLENNLALAEKEPLSEPFLQKEEAAEDVESLSDDSASMSYEEAKKKAAAGEGTITDLPADRDKRNSENPCEGGVPIQSPGGEGPTACFYANDSVSSSPEIKLAEEEVSLTEQSKDLPLEIREETPNHDSWAKPVEFKIEESKEPLTVDEASFSIQNLAPETGTEEAAVKVTLAARPVELFVSAVRDIQPNYRLEPVTLKDLRYEVRSAFADLTAIIKERAEAAISEEKSGAKSALLEARSAFQERKEEVMTNYASPGIDPAKRGEPIRTLVQNKKEAFRSAETSREGRIDQIKADARTQIASYESLYKAADSTIRDYQQAFKRGTLFTMLMPAQDATAFNSGSEKDSSLLG